MIDRSAKDLSSDYYLPPFIDADAQGRIFVPVPVPGRYRVHRFKDGSITLKYMQGLALLVHRMLWGLSKSVRTFTKES